MLPATVNLEIYHGDSWSQNFKLLQDNVPVDLSSATVAASAVGRSGDSLGDSVPITAAVVVGSPGTIKLSLAPGAISAGVFSYDVQVTKSGTVTTWIRGDLTVVPDVT